jgi:hypothetical protein
VHAIAVAVALTAALSAQARIDLTAFQTPIRNQGSRTTCIAFAATAALEARYRHIGTTVDLSEEFVNYMGKMSWLHPYWSAITTADMRENQLGATAGGGGVGHAHNFVYWEKVPVEATMPYRTTEYPISLPWSDPHWLSQRNTNDWNLDPTHLPRAALTQTNYYSASGLVDLGYAGATSTASIEAALQAGYEVVWDCSIAGDITGSIWHASSAGSIGGHSMLIVGYDRTSTNPANQYFIVKNSWGPTANTGGFTYIGYDYIQYGINACYLTGAATPSVWPQLRFLGRRNLSFDGFHGTLDIYHLPGSSSEIWSSIYGVTTPDNRLGTLYDSAGNAYRVNGYFAGNTLVFWWKGTNPNMPWDELRDLPTLGRMFQYTLLDASGDELAGIHWDNAGVLANPAYGGYAIMPTTILGTDGFLSPVFDNSQGWVPDQWIGEWVARFGINDGAQIVVGSRDDTLVPPAQVGVTAGYRCWYRPGVDVWLPGDWLPFTGLVPIAGASSFGCTLPTASAPYYEIFHMLSWERGVAAAANAFQAPFGYRRRLRPGLRRPDAHSQRPPRTRQRADLQRRQRDAVQRRDHRPRSVEHAVGQHAAAVQPGRLRRAQLLPARRPADHLLPADRRHRPRLGAGRLQPPGAVLCARLLAGLRAATRLQRARHRRQQRHQPAARRPALSDLGVADAATWRQDARDGSGRDPLAHHPLSRRAHPRLRQRQRDAARRRADRDGAGLRLSAASAPRRRRGPRAAGRLPRRTRRPPRRQVRALRGRQRARAGGTHRRRRVRAARGRARGHRPAALSHEGGFHQHSPLPAIAAAARIRTASSSAGRSGANAAAAAKAASCSLAKLRPSSATSGSSVSV